MIERGSLLCKIILALGCFICVSWQLSVCIKKYLSNPISTSLSFGKLDDETDITVTFCYKGFGTQGTGFHSFYEVNKSSKSFLGHLDKSFIRSLDVQLKEHTKWHDTWNQSSGNDEEMFSAFIQPYPDLGYCNSWTIPKQVSRFRIKEAATKNLMIYVHGPDIHRNESKFET